MESRPSPCPPPTADALCLIFTCKVPLEARAVQVSRTALDGVPQVVVLVYPSDTTAAWSAVLY